MADKEPLEDLRKAHEEEYFERKNRELVAKLREKLASESGVEALRIGTGVNDDETLRRLAAVGITSETAPVLHLVPLVQVAWADGEVQPDERDMLLRAAEERGMQPGSPPFTLLEAILTRKPSAEFFDAALDFIGALLAAMPADQAADARQNLERLSVQVARATGGLFGRFWNMSDDEKSALEQISRRLDQKSSK